MTNRSDIYGGRALQKDISFSISTVWSGDTKQVDRHGATPFGPLIATDAMEGIIISSIDLVLSWDVVHDDNSFEFTATHKVERDISLRFDFQDKLLSARVPARLWERICQLDPVGDCLTGEQREALLKYTLSRDEYKRVLEAIRFHECASHAGLAQMIMTTRHNVFANCPVTSRDIENILFVNSFGCLRCECGKSKHRTGNPRKVLKARLDELRREMPDVFERGPGETLGLDLMFINGQIYLICVGKLYGMTHVVPLPSKKEGPVAAAIAGIVQDYRQNQVEVVQLMGEPTAAGTTVELTEPITGTESDNEGAFIAAACKLLPGMGIHSEFVATGEHVGYVERPIQVIKERVDATIAGLAWIPEGRMLDFLVLNVSRWLNVLSTRKSPRSAWRVVTQRPLCYRSLTLTQFGDIVVAHRSKASLAPGEAKGELGMSMGPMLNTQGAIYFYSFVTKQVKVRKRFVIAEPLDLVKDFPEDFKPNRFYIPRGGVAESYLSYLRDRATEVSPPEGDEEDRLPAAGTYMTSGAAIPEGAEAATPVSDGVHKVINPVEPQPRDNTMSYDRADYARDRAEFASTATEAERARVKLDQEQLTAAMHAEEANIMEALKAKEAEALDTPENRSALEEASKDEQRPELQRRATKSDLTGEPGQRAPRPYRKARENNWRSAHSRKMLARRRMKRNVFIRKYIALGEDKLPNAAETSTKTCSWKKAFKTRPKSAPDAAWKEIKQIVDTYGVCEAVKKSLEIPDYHRMHDLHDVKANGDDKCRLVLGKLVKGIAVDYGIDPYSPTIDMKVVTLMLSLALEKELELTVWDVKGAFLKAPMTTDGVFAKASPHIADMMCQLHPDWDTEEYRHGDGSLMVRVKKAWYGLAPASALWHAEIDRTLTEDCGYKQHSMVKCLYYRVDEQGETSYMMLHVDDIGALMPKDGVERSRVQDILEAKYEKLKCQDSDTVTYIGIEITRNRVTNKFELNMEKRIEKCLSDFGVDPLRKSPVNPAKNARFSVNEPPEDEEPFDDTTKFRSLVMTEAYMCLVRPHVRFHVAWLATKQNNPTVADWGKAVYLLQYLYGTKSDAMLVGAMGTEVVVRVQGDAAFDVHADSKSHSGLCVFVGNAGCAVYASSTKQHCITRSSTDAEVVTAETGVMIGSFYRDVLEEIGVKADVIHDEDNQACIALTKTGATGYDRREKHLIRRINFMHDYLGDGANRSAMIWCPTTEMIADVLTKDLHGDIFLEHAGKLMGRTPHVFERTA